MTEQVRVHTQHRGPWHLTVIRCGEHLVAVEEVGPWAPVLLTVIDSQGGGSIVDVDEQQLAALRDALTATLRRVHRRSGSPKSANRDRGNSAA